MIPLELTTPQIIMHVVAGVLGILSGVIALIATKGSPLHRRAGTVFFVVMGTTAATGGYMGFAGGDPANGVAGIVTLYLVATSWVTVRRAEGKIGAFEFGAFLFAAIGAAGASWVAFDAVRNNSPLFGGLPYVIIAAVITLAAVADLSVLLRRGLRGRQRVARHLWRMQLGFAAAVGSFFPGQLEHFPEAIQNIRPIIILFIPFFAVIGVMLAWLVVVLLTRWYDGAEEARA